MYFESLRAENIRHLEPCELDFRDGQDAIRKWTVLEATDASHALLRCVALGGLGRRQMPLLARRVNGELVGQPDRPAHLEFVLIRHAPQERRPHSPVRQQSGWHFWADGRVAPVLKPALRSPGWGARFSPPDLGRSHRGRLVVGYGRRVIPYVGTDQFDIYPDQRLRRCAGLFEAAARVTDPVAFLDRLRHKSCYRAGRARALLARLSADLSAWLGWDVMGHLTRLREFVKCWHAAPVTRRSTPSVLEVAGHQAFQ